MEIAFDDIKHFITDILLVECHSRFILFGPVNVPNTGKKPWRFCIRCAR